MKTEDPPIDSVRFSSIADLMPVDGAAELEDYILDLRWSADGRLLAAMPSTGAPKLLDPSARILRELPGHRGGNGSLGWSPKHNTLATLGLDSILRLHDAESGKTREGPLPRGWTEHFAWNADGNLIAVANDRAVHIVNPDTLEVLEKIEGHTATVCDVLWHPRLPDRLATASDGGARIWKLGTKEPVGRIDDGVAALSLSWSPDARWLVTGDQTPSVHLLDIPKSDPLYIQGFASKAKAFAWLSAGRKDVPWLAVSGSATITLWPCFGKGPSGSKPLQLEGHLKEVIALDIPRNGQYLASGGRDGLVLFWLPHEIERPVLIAQEKDEITALRWSPDGQRLAYGTSAGHVVLHKIK